MYSGTRNKVTLNWIPGYSDVEAREKVEELSIIESKYECMSPEPFPVGTAKGTAKGINSN